MCLPKFSMGIGDRFAHQGVAQLNAIIEAGRQGAGVAPVWNKSHREHIIVGSSPGDVRDEADHAVQLRGWKGRYFVDADHIGLGVVDGFLDSSDFFTLDVADAIGNKAPADDIEAFVGANRALLGSLAVPGIDKPLQISEDLLRATAEKFLLAVAEAGRIYRHIAAAKGRDNFVTEVSMDETDQPQTPVEMLLILAAVAAEGIPAQTIAPRFSGRFNKGVDYVGDVARFTQEFEADLAVIDFAVQRFGLPGNLKLSVHSGSDKFAIYGPISRAIKRFDAGVHLKTAGTTWLEELIGLAAAGGDGLAIAKSVYRSAHGRRAELCGPYASVVDIDSDKLPSPDEVDGWNATAFTSALRHDQSCPAYNQNLRQLLHVGYKVAAELGTQYTDALDKHATVVAENVGRNILERHIRPLFME
ncbi:MAG: tagaturonate epimerase family protein [Planctomycetota bacterium]|nr:tagaturonate epimerase family protein [Planctomycetota bacterium]